MLRCAFVVKLGLVAGSVFVLTETTRAAVNLGLQPGLQVVNVGDTIEVQLLVSSNGSGAQSLDALDAVFTWDPSLLSLVGFDNSGSGAMFFATGFFPDPDGINTDLNDGDAIFTALGPPGSPIDVPVAPGNLIVTTFQFEALAPTSDTDIELALQIGVFGRTRALLNGSEVTGKIKGPSTVTINAPATCATDIVSSVTFMPPPDGIVDGADLAYLLGEWGVNPGSLADFVTSATFMPPPDGIVDGADLAILLGDWGPCH